MAYKRATDEMFIRGTVDCVAKGGIENLRTKDIADYTGFSEATLFRCFESKIDLLNSTFLFIDERLAGFIINDRFFKEPGTAEFDAAFERIWRGMYRWLVENSKDALFLIRYRHSSLYKDEIRRRRALYNGSFENVNCAMKKHFEALTEDECRFISGCIIEMTLFFVEKIIDGELQDTKETEDFVFGAFHGSLDGLIKNRKEKGRNDR